MALACLIVHYLDIVGLKPRPTDTKIVGSKKLDQDSIHCEY
jgi:hypothetical protein